MRNTLLAIVTVLFFAVIGSGCRSDHSQVTDNTKIQTPCQWVGTEMLVGTETYRRTLRCDDMPDLVCITETYRYGQDGMSCNWAAYNEAIKENNETNGE